MTIFSKSIKQYAVRVAVGSALSLSIALPNPVQAFSALSSVIAQSIGFVGADITGTHFGKGLTAVDELGQETSFERFKGKVVLVFFGYTQCPDVCPTALAEMASLLTQLTPEEAKQVEVVVVSIDPERDNPETLKAYLEAFDENFKGMTGTPEQVDKIARSFRAYYKKVAYTSGTYAMEHSSSIYALDKQGESRIIFRPNMSSEDIVKDVRQLLKES